MDRKISQKIFNELVFENIEEFEMSGEEAVDFAVTQFEAQEVDLSNVLADINVIRGTDAVTQFCTKCSSSDELDTENFFRSMETATVFACLSPQHKLHAGRMDLHRMIIKNMNKRRDDSSVIERCLINLEKIVKGYPDLLDEGLILQLLELRDTHKSETRIAHLVHLTLLNSIEKHEKNKDVLFGLGIAVKIISECMMTYDDDDICLGCRFIIHLCKDDDVRVEISQVYTRATSLAGDFMADLYSRLKLWQSAETTTSLVQAVAAMAVNNDLVKGLFNIDPEFEIIQSFPRKENLIKCTNKLLVALSGNDECKSQMAQLIPWIVSTVDNNLTKPYVIQSSLLLISSLCLRSETNALAFIELHTIEKIVQAMKVYPAVKVQRYGCMAMRNMASSTKVPQPFEDSGVIDLVNELLKSQPDVTEECKALLVALGAPVSLTERWTGVKGDVVGGN